VKVFVSWSGEKSKAASLAFCSFLEDTIQQVTTWFSARDIPRGSLGVYELMKALGECEMGVMLVTQENYQSPWMHFEAGALFTAYQQDQLNSRVCPVLLDLTHSTLIPPLKELQTTEHSMPEMLDLVRNVNAQLPPQHVVDESRLVRNFNKQWPHYEEAIQKVLLQYPVSHTPQPAPSPKVVADLDIHNSLGELRRLILELRADLLPANLRDWNSFIEEVKKLKITTYALVMNTTGFVRDGVCFILVPMEKAQAAEYIKQPGNMAIIKQAAKSVFPDVKAVDVKIV
jgi:hypothetical protein